MALTASPIPQFAESAVRPLNLAEAWHLLSLDAPTVAVLWSWSFAQAADVHLPPWAPLLLGMGTWLVYVADRLMDGLRADSWNLRLRHYFHLRHRRAFVAAAIGCGVLLAWLIVTCMAPSARKDDVAVFAMAALYFAAVHSRARSIERWLPKELAVGILFAAAVAVPAWSRLGDARWMLLPTASLFAALCWLNCVAIEVWEHGSAAAGHASFLQVNVTTRLVGARFTIISGVIAAISSTLGLMTGGSHRGMSALDFAVTTAVLLLALLHARRTRLTAMQLRIAADAALLTPLLVWPFLR